MVVLICVDHEETTWQVTSIPFSRAKQQRTGTARWQNNETNYRRQKAHVNMWNKADICAVLLSNETSTAPFPRCLQNVADISRTNIHRFVQEEHWISAKIGTYRVTKVKIYLVKYKHYEEIFFLPPDIGVAVLVCLRSPVLPVSLGYLCWIQLYPTQSWSGLSVSGGIITFL